jgi:hypothetical protein
MSTLLSTLLCINGQLQSATQPRRASISLPRPAPIERPVIKPSASKRILWAGLSVLTLLIAFCSIVYFALGIQQVNHTRERIRWSRQLQQREQEVSRLARERQILQGLMALKASEWAKPEMLPAAYPGATVRTPVNKQKL